MGDHYSQKVRRNKELSAGFLLGLLVLSEITQLDINLLQLQSLVLNLLIKHLNQILGLLSRLRQLVESLKLAHVRKVVEELEFLVGILFDNINVLLLLLVHELFFNLPFEVLVY